MTNERADQCWECRMRPLIGKRLVAAAIPYDEECKDFIPKLAFEDGSLLMMLNDRGQTADDRLVLIPGDER